MQEAGQTNQAMQVILLGQAWCTANPAFNTALEHKAKIAQLVIGTTSYFTASSCLDELKDFPPARVFAPNASPMFHPKVYAFDLGKGSGETEAL